MQQTQEQSFVRTAVSRMLAGDPVHVVAAIALDVLVLAAAYAAALMLRFDGDVPRNNAEFTASAFPILAAAYVLANLVFGVYRTVWAYGSLGDVLALFRPVVLVTAIIFGTNFWLNERLLPLSVVLMAGVLALPGMAMVKMRSRLLNRVPWASVESRRMLIIGAGHTGQLLARELQNRQALNYQPVAFVDDDPRKQHTRIHGLRVTGPIDSLPDLIRRYQAEIVAIAVPGAPGHLVREIVAACQQANVSVRIVPSVDHWVSGSPPPGQALREITLDDLLGREPVSVDMQACSQSVRDRVVVVTGAAGSIGSELVRQILSFQPREMHLLDNNESGLFDLASEVRSISSQTTLKLWIASVVDEAKIDAIFNRVRPELVYHAAAYKHVPLMEEHPDEAFRVNVIGTLNVARAARTYESGMFVLISTDKAVRPSSIMGATKRIAELMVLALARSSERTNYTAVRFGNVMGSRGSAPLTFMRQIENGGPVTITHPDMWRYFISIPEAVSLVIQAGTFGGRGNIFMLDMGEEINMLELAERMIRLRGLRPNEDIEIKFTGPRPGEKLREELVADFEQLESTHHPKVHRLSATVDVSEPELQRLIDELAIVVNDHDELRRRIMLIPRRFANESPDDQAEPVATPAEETQSR